MYVYSINVRAIDTETLTNTYRKAADVLRSYTCRLALKNRHLNLVYTHVCRYMYFLYCATCTYMQMYKLYMYFLDLFTVQSCAVTVKREQRSKCFR